MSSIDKLVLTILLLAVAVVLSLPGLTALGRETIRRKLKRRRTRILRRRFGAVYARLKTGARE